MSRRAAVILGCGAALAVVTGVAAYLLLDVNREIYPDWINFDPQGDEQQWDDLRMTAALMYTSGHAVGHCCALLFGMVVGMATPGTAPSGTASAGTASSRRWRWLSPATALAGGSVLAAVNLTVALPRARAGVPRLWMVDELTRHGFAFDPNLLHDAGVRAFLGTGLVAFALFAVVGLGLTRWRGWAFAVVGALLWYPVSIVGGFVTGGFPALVVPLYSNAGTANLVLRWPLASVAVTAALALWAAALCVTGFAADIVRAGGGADPPVAR